MGTFLLGCASSLVAVLLVWWFREYLIPELKRRVFSGTPSVGGTYDLIKADDDAPHLPDDNAAPKTVILKQSGAKVTGTVIHPPDAKSKLTGYVTGSRLMTFMWEPEDKNIHDYGTAVLKLNFDGTGFMGVVTFLCSCCEDITPTPVLMRKTDDPHDK